MVHPIIDDYKKQIYELKLQVDVLNERLAIQKVEFEEENKELKSKIKNLTNISFELSTKNLYFKRKLKKIYEIVSDELNLKFDITQKLKEIKEIIESEE